MRKLLFAMFMLLSVCLQLKAQSNTASSNFPLKKIPNLPSNFYLTELPNGLEVLVMEDNSVPLATIELVVRNGAFVQTPELEGLAHLYEHMFFKANAEYPSQEAYLERINELGIVFNGTTSEERVNYFITLGESKLQEGLEFMNASARSPKFLEEEMKKENVVVAGEFQRNESSPFFHLFQGMNERLWGDELSRKNTIGRYEVILNATPEIMQDIKNRYYYPDNSMLVIAGDVEHQDVFKRVSNVFGDWKHSDFNIFEKYPIPEFDPIAYNQTFVIENPNARVPVVLMGWHGPDTRKSLEATYAADVFSFILSQKNSQLQKALVETGLALQVSVNYSTLRYTGPIQVILVPNPTKVKEAIAALQKEISKWDNPEYYTDEQMQTAKEMLEIQDMYGKEQTSSYVHTITYWWASASLDYYANYIKNLKAVTKEDIVKYVQTYIKGKPHVTGILVSPQMRKMINLDEFFVETKDISEYTVGVTGIDVVEFEQEAEGKFKEIGQLMKLNPDKRLKVYIHSTKEYIATMRGRELQDQLEKYGVDKNRIEWNFNITKPKKMTEEDKKKMDTITFSF